MNEQLPPVDPALRDQLARRSAGRRSAGLLDDVLSAVDVAPASASVGLSAPVISLASFRRNPRVSGALVGLAAAVVLVAALVAVPALRSGPAASSYPTDRALTTAELADVMAGPALATNTALVADVTITAKPDVCPMNRYPTVGVIEGMKSQVCVMAGSVTYDLKPAGAGHGIYAFRYLAPGVLGLLGEITAAPSKLAFKVTDEWPLAAKTFVVDGWLGETTTEIPCWGGPDTYAPGDVLSPNGDECGYASWLSDVAAPDAIVSPAAGLIAGKSVDQMALYTNARLVKAGGMRQIDAVAVAAHPVHGRFVVKSQTGPCEGQSPISSTGCSYWLVLAKLGDIAAPNATSTPAPTKTRSPTPAYPTDRALTPADLGALLDGGSLKLYDTVVADVAVSPGSSATCDNPGSSGGTLLGVVVGLEPAVCVFGIPGDVPAGHQVLRKLANRTLGYMATVPSAPDGIAYSAAAAWPEAAPDDFFLVRGWLGTDARDCGQSSLRATGGANPLWPAYNTMCMGTLTASRFDPSQFKYTGPTPAGPPRIWVAPFDVPSDGKLVDSAPVFEVPAGAPVSGTVEGTYLVQKRTHVSALGGDSEDYYALARLADLAVEPPATPVPETSATAVALTTPHPGYQFDAALTRADLEGRLVKGNIAVGATVVASVKMKENPGCEGSGSASPADEAEVVGMASKLCVRNVYSASMNVTAPFALRFVGPGVMEDLGQIEPMSATQLVRGATDSWPYEPSANRTFLLGGYLRQGSTTATISDGTKSNLMALIVDPSAQLGVIDPSRYAVFVVVAEWFGTSPTDGQPTGDGIAFHVVGKVEDLGLLPAGPVSTPTAEPSNSPSQPTAAVWASGDRPFTVSELIGLGNQGDKSVIEGRTVVTKGPVPLCLGIQIPEQCGGQSAGEGTWAIHVTHGKTSVVGQLSTPGGRFVSTLGQVAGDAAPPAGSLIVVDGYLLVRPLTCNRDASYDPKCDSSVISSEPVDQALFSFDLQTGAYELGTGAHGDIYKLGPPVEGRFLIRITNGGVATLIGVLSSK